MTRSLAPLYLAAGMVVGLWAAPGSRIGRRQAANVSLPPDGRPGAALLSEQLDAIDARIAALAYPDPRHCDDACLTGVERVELKRGAVSCRCRRLPSLGVHRLPEAGR